MALPKLYRPEEASEMTHVPVATLKYWRRTRQGPKFVRLGRNIVHREDDLNAWIEEQAAQTNRQQAG